MTGEASLADRIYRWLLGLYPADVRERFGEEMVQLFHDKLRDARAGRAPWGMAGAWLNVLADLAVTAPAEHLRRQQHVAHSMSSNPSLEARFLGFVGVLGGAALLSAFMIEWPSGPNALRIAIFNAGAVAVMIAVLRRRDAPTSPILLAVTGVAIVFNAIYAAMTMADIHAAVNPWAGVALWLSSALFGVAALRLGGLTAWGALAVAVGCVLAVTGIDQLGLVSAASPTIFNALSQIGIGAVGIGWIMLGIDAATAGLRRQPAL